MNDALIGQLKALAHPLRFRIMEVLSGGEHNVGEIEAATQIGQPTLSQQLGVLRNAGLVQTRKEAKMVYYRPGQDRLEEIAELVRKLGPQRDNPPASPHSASPGAANFARIT
ncbi:ArsR/SmtB family transcription factor [Erythrobacter sp. MTPC3]|uniref:ArsR/SmtB family transcription factor n=1 Tax=Erythrobacter sp. MTPC3 TaxID=3056564 RepID=UPI0036F22118